MAGQTLAERILRAAGIGAIGFGAVASLAPRAFAGVYGLGEDPHTRVLTRLWGTRTVVLGAIALGVGSPQDQRAVMTAAAAMNSADALFAATAPGISVRGRVLGSLSSGSFAAALAYGLANDR